MTKDDKILYVFNRLKELHKKAKTIAYSEIGGENDTHYRHVDRQAAYTQLAIQVYNKRHGTKLPHLNALIVNKQTRRPGCGCLTDNPLEVLSFEYESHYPEIEKILKYILTIKENLLWDDDTDIVTPIHDLIYRGKKGISIIECKET